MILIWLAGDSAKFYYYVSTGQKMPFLVSGVIQLTLDLVLLLQKLRGSKSGKGGSIAVISLITVKSYSCSSLLEP